MWSTGWKRISVHVRGTWCRPPILSFPAFSPPPPPTSFSSSFFFLFPLILYDFPLYLGKSTGKWEYTYGWAILKDWWCPACLDLRISWLLKSWTFHRVHRENAKQPPSSVLHRLGRNWTTSYSFGPFRDSCRGHDDFFFFLSTSSTRFGVSSHQIRDDHTWIHIRKKKTSGDIFRFFPPLPLVTYSILSIGDAFFQSRITFYSDGSEIQAIEHLSSLRSCLHYMEFVNILSEKDYIAFFFSRRKDPSWFFFPS